MSALNWQEMYPKFQEMQQQWFDGISAMIEASAEQDKATAACELFKINQEFFVQQAALWQQSFQPAQKEAFPDKRFSDEAWEQPGFNWIRHYYLLTSQWMLQLVNLLPGSEETRARLRFFTQQFLAAMSPANFLMTNPQVLAKAAETQGASLRQGMENFLKDREKGRLSITDESQFEIGVNVATTQGGVIFENELIQILQYAPLTPTVFERPLLIVPPCVNKYYLMDLQPTHSMVRYLVEQGHRVFLISWKSITPELGHLRWDDYIEQGVFAAIDVVCDITHQPQINTLGFCIGGIILSTAAAVAKARGQEKIASVSLMATMLDHCEPGEIRFFIDEALVRSREARLAEGGVVRGADLAAAFSLLRSKDLIWKPAVDSYLLGEAPVAFDLLYWNSDSTNLALPMHTFFLREMYLENALTVPGKVLLCGTSIDLRTLTMPTYLFAASEDHITPWQGVYASLKLLGGNSRFVLGASGHIAGAINPVSKNKRNYWVNENLTLDAATWFAQAQSRPGSWWQDWVQWLQPQAGKQIRALKRLGNAQYKVIEPAPGRYVKEKAV
jgi:polyhydroxyalkanoate synthase